MDCIEIEGGVQLHGHVRVSGAKNAALPVMASLSAALSAPRGLARPTSGRPCRVTGGASDSAVSAAPPTSTVGETATDETGARNR